MKILLRHPYTLAVRPAERGWEILCQTGPLSALFSGMARDLGATNGQSPRTEQIGGRTFTVVPLTEALDEAVARLIDALIDLRYESGRVQLELFVPEDWL